jgi:hypothetical protein
MANGKQYRHLMKPRPKKQKGPRAFRPKSLRCKMPETGLEPALPLQQPGPQPGFSAKSWYCRGVDVMLQVVKEHWLTACKLAAHIVVM